MKPFYLKGATGEMLDEIRRTRARPFRVERGKSTARIVDGSGYRFFSLTVRGNSRDRRRTCRQLERWLNAEPKP